MKRLLLSFLGSLFILQLFTPVASADTNNFSLSNFRVDYYLSKDSEGRSHLKTVEKITAEFPTYNQNHGIERAIPKSYDGHPTHVNVISVTNDSGSALPYSTRTSNDNIVLRIGEKDKYAHGSTTYVIAYEQRDVTRYFSDTKRDEFYWDTNGTEWAVPIAKLNATIHVSGDILKSFSGHAACYVGANTSTQRCDVAQGTTSFYASAANLRQHENLTLAIGFNAQTFTAYQPSLSDIIAKAWIALFTITSIIGVGFIIWLSARWSNWSGRKKELGTIVPEYLPPKDTSVTTSASLVPMAGGTFTAQLLDFAVRHYIKIYETKEKGKRFWSTAEYDIEIIRDIKDLLPEEQELISDIFAGSTAVGQRLALKSLQNNTKVYKSMQDNDKKLTELVRGRYAVRAKDEKKSVWFKKMGWILIAAAVITLSPVLLVAALFSFIYAHSLWPLTDKGLALRRYLDGLKMYIEVAETERLKMLQSPEGAEKVGTDTNDSVKLVKLYERVLPYAVLFGQEKEWNKQIGSYYEKAGSSPDWYSGHAAFNAAVFSSAMSSFATSASYTSASSSSSGGSSGGGSSGGGGGGGGGGGW